MAPSSSSSPSKSPVLSLHFTPILECEEEDLHEEKFKNRATPNNNHQHTQTPLHRKRNGKPPKHDDDEDDGGAVSCNNCRPHHSHRDKFSIVPHESHNTPSFISSPNLILKSIYQSFTRKSPKPSSSASSASREEQLRLTVAELSHKLIQTTKKKEDAIIEASKLKSSMAELEKKLTKLEIYCHNLKSGLDECSNKKQSINGFNETIIKQFIISVSESRSSIRALSRALVSQLRTVGEKVYERLSLLLQPFDVNINSFAKNPKSLILYLEAILSRVFFEDFEVSGFKKNGSTRILNPIDRCESNYASFNDLTELTWDEVLNRGTKHFSEEFSRFCDRKMSDVVSILCWNRAWPEPLLQAFFGASKSVWLVHLLANSLNPSLQIFRVEKDDRFDPIYMEETSGDRVKSLVRAMVQPGFYVYGSVVKCKVICKHCGSDQEVVDDCTVEDCKRNDKSLTSICSPLGI